MSSSRSLPFSVVQVLRELQARGGRAWAADVVREVDLPRRTAYWALERADELGRVERRRRSGMVFVVTREDT